MACSHRLNKELDLQKFMWASMSTAVPVLISEAPQPPPPPPAFGLIYEGAIGQPRWTTSPVVGKNQSLMCKAMIFPL